MDAFPDDLEDYLTRMLDSIASTYQKRAARVLLMLLQETYFVPYLIEVTPILDEKCDTINLQMSSLNCSQLDDLLDTTRRRLSSHCRDLVEVHQEMYDHSEPSEKLESCGTTRHDEVCSCICSCFVISCVRLASVSLSLPDLWH